LLSKPPRRAAAVAAFGTLPDRCAVRHGASVAAFDALDGRGVSGIM